MVQTSENPLKAKFREHGAAPILLVGNTPGTRPGPHELPRTPLRRSSTSENSTSTRLGESYPYRRYPCSVSIRARSLSPGRTYRRSRCRTRLHRAPCLAPAHLWSCAGCHCRNRHRACRRLLPPEFVTSFAPAHRVGAGTPYSFVLPGAAPHQVPPVAAVEPRVGSVSTVKLVNPASRVDNIRSVLRVDPVLASRAVHRIRPVRAPTRATRRALDDRPRNSAR